MAADCLGWLGKKGLSQHGMCPGSQQSRDTFTEETPVFEPLQAETSPAMADLSDQTEQIPHSDPADGSKLL